jgi:hypothetical protein
LEAVGPTVAGIAALGERVRLTLAFEIGAGDVVEQELVLEVEEVAESLTEMFLQLVLMRQKLIERGIQAIGMNFLGWYSEEIIESCSPIPCVLDVQLAGGLAETSNGEDRGHLVPGYLLATLRYQSLEQHVESKQSPETQGKPDIAKSARTLKANVAKLDEDWFVFGRVVVMRRVEERPLGTGLPLTIKCTTELGPTALFARGKLSQISDDAVT